VNGIDARAISETLRNPQLEPADHCLTVLQDFGPDGGGWGPVAVPVPWLPVSAPFVYTGSDPNVEGVMARICRQMAQETGRPTRLVRFTQREDVAVFGGSS
jgi:hypothetical protein